MVAHWWESQLVEVLIMMNSLKIFGVTRYRDVLVKSYDSTGTNITPHSASSTKTTPYSALASLFGMT